MMTSRLIYLLVTGEKPPRRAPRKWNGRGPARNAKYRAWVRSLPCAVSGRTGEGVEAAHTGSDGGMRQKASDFSCIPLHAEFHTMGPLSYHALGRDEFERVHGIRCAAVVRTLNRAWFQYSQEVK